MRDSPDLREKWGVVQHDEIRLALPAAPEYARIARLTVAGLATRLGFSYDEVEDLRIAVGEACSVLMVDPPVGRIEVVYRLNEDALEIEATADQSMDGVAGDTSEAADSADMSVQILGAVVDEHRIDAHAGRVWIRKRRADG